MKKQKKGFQVIIWLVLLVVMLLVAFWKYAQTYYKALPYENEAVTVTETDDYYVIGDTDAARGFIFYPGAKVEESAYLPVLTSLSEADVCCVLVKMPYQLAIFNQNAAAGVMEDFPQIENWYIGGHSLGGAMAAGFAAKHEEELQGLILLAAYPTDALSELPVLSVYGSEDGVLNLEKYQKSITLADHLSEYVIEGGNHAQFGNYGEQKKDGTATITAKEQWQETVDYILMFMNETE